jgi:hypothetical protein
LQSLHGFATFALLKPGMHVSKFCPELAFYMTLSPFGNVQEKEMKTKIDVRNTHWSLMTSTALRKSLGPPSASSMMIQNTPNGSMLGFSVWADPKLSVNRDS